MKEVSCSQSSKRPHIKPLYKGNGHKKGTNNYRGISLLSCSYQLFTGVLYDRIERWTEVNQILPDSQFGFRKGRSTIQADTKLTNTIKFSVASHKGYYACFVDFKKAFDTINRHKLLDELQKLGIKNNMLMAIRAVLQPNMVQVKDGPFLSKLIVQHDGVPQGDKLSPLLFSIFIADLEPNRGKKCHTIFYADDLIIGSHIRQDVQEVLQKCTVKIT